MKNYRPRTWVKPTKSTKKSKPDPKYYDCQLAGCEERSAYMRDGLKICEKHYNQWSNRHFRSIEI